MHGAGVLSDSYAVYLGATQQRDEPVRVLPVRVFLDELSAGRVRRSRTARTKRPSR